MSMMQADVAECARQAEDLHPKELVSLWPQPKDGLAELLSRFPWSLLNRIVSALATHSILLVLGLALKWFKYATAMCSAVADALFARALGTSLSFPSMLASLLDARGMGWWGTPHLGGSEFCGVTAVIVGDAGDVSLKVASEMVTGSADTVHLVSGACGKVWKAVGLLRELEGASHIVPHAVDFSHPGAVHSWCKELRQTLCGRGQQIGVVVLGSVTDFPKEHRLSTEALDDAFAADVICLQALLVGLGPALAPGARVVITTSAASCWQSRSGGDRCCGRVALGGSCLESLEARVQQQAARVALGRHQARKWAAQPQGPVCLICTPSVLWSAWTDVLAWAGLLEALKESPDILCAPWLWGLAQEVHAAVAARVAGNVVHLCRHDVAGSPAEYYWGRCRVAGFRGYNGEGVFDVDLERMLVALACRSGQLPG